MGNFTDAEVNGTVYTYADTQAAGANGATLAGAGPLVDVYNGIKMATVAQWQGGNSAPYIISQMGGAWVDNNMGTELSKLGVEPTANEWFTLSYIIDGSKKNGSHQASRIPADTATGPFYFAIGLPGQNSGNTFGIKNVILVSNGTADDVLGMPLYYKDDGAAGTAAAGDTGGVGTDNLYRAYNGQFTKDGSNGTNLANWRVVKGSANIVPVDKSSDVTAPTLVTVTFNRNYSGAPANTTLKVVTGEKLASSQLAKPERVGFLCTGWFDAATDGTEVTNATVISADKTIYAQWRSFTPNMTPWVINNPTMILNGGATFVSGSTGPIQMGGGTSPTNGALVNFSFTDDALAAITGCPSDKLGGFLKVKVDFTATRGSDDTQSNKTMSLSIKNGASGYNNTPAALRPDGFNGYPDLGAADATTFSGSFEWPLSLFSSPPDGVDPGFGLQINFNGTPPDHSTSFVLNITRITFSYN